MSRGSSKRYFLPEETKVELVAIKNNEVFIKEMTYREAVTRKRKIGWTYKIYQLGFSQFKQTKR